jgi:soluble lytic murein transglycosylase-like protein
MSAWLLFIVAMILMAAPAFSNRAAQKAAAPYRFALGIVLWICSEIISCASADAAERVPDAAAMYRRMVEQAVSDHWGVTGSSALLAAQLHQESAWRPKVTSKAGAMGMAQFMPATAQWIAEKFPRELGHFDPWDPAQAIKGAAIYDRYLYHRVPPSASECDRWAFTLAAYNGGLGWVIRDANRASATGADSARWFGQVEFAADTRRSAANVRENRRYVDSILRVLEPLYLTAGWPGDAVCP